MLGTSIDVRPASPAGEFEFLVTTIVAIAITNILVLDLPTQKTMKLKTLFEEYVAVQRGERGW